jgi:membrane protease YdiL (CAAX protease family)
MGRDTFAVLRQNIDRNPVRSAILFWGLLILLNILAGFVALVRQLTPLQLVTFADIMVGIAGIFLIAGLLWWRRAGFTTLGRRRDFVLYLLPIGVAFLSLTEGTATAEVSVILTFALFALVVGFAEETFFRGLILQSLRPVGVFGAVLGSAVLFGLPHLLNAVGGIWDPVFTIGDTFAAFGIGVTFAALVLRTGTIWPVILIHALIDFTALIAQGTLVVQAQSFGEIMVTVGVGVVMTIYGLYLIRDRKTDGVDLPPSS